MKIIGYTYEADCHCVSCAQKRFIASHKASNLDYHGLRMDQQDREGNPIHPMFSTDEQLEPQYCGDCHERISC